MRQLVFGFALIATAIAPIAFPQTPMACGQAVTGIASTAGNTFSFSVADNDSIMFRFIGANANLNAPVVQDIGKTVTIARRTKGVGIDSLGNMLIYDFPNRGTYQISITGTGGASYQLVYVSLAHPCAGDAGFTCGALVKSALGVGQMQMRQFSGKTGDPITLRFLNTGGDPGATLRVVVFDSNAQVQLANPGQLILFDVTNIVEAPYKLTTDGLQTVVLMETSGKLKINYTASMINVNGSCSATAVSCGAAVDGSINDGLGTGIYSLTAAKGDVYQLRLLTTDSSGGLQAQIQVFDPQGNTVIPVTGSDPTRAQLPITAAGAYTLIVIDQQRINTGKFTLSTVRLNNPCSTAVPLGCGTSTAGQVTGPLRNAIYSLAAQAGDIYLLRLLRTASGTGFTPKVEVYAPSSDGSPVQNVKTSDLGRATFTASAAGTYNLLAFDDSDSTQSGAFTLSVTRLNRPCAGSATLSCGSLAPGSIAQPLQTGMYSYTTTAADAFTVRLIDTGGTLQTALEVYDPRGNPVPVAAGATKAVDVTNSPGGPYTILVTDQSRTPQQGAFALEAFSTRGGCGANPGQGQSVNGLVSGPVPFTSYVFNANAGDALLVRSAAFTPGFSANIDLYDPSGKRLGSGSSGVTPPVLTATGPYTAIVGASAARGVGSYAFSWQLLNNPVAPPLQCGLTSSGALGTASQFWYYTINANDNDLLKLLLTRLPSTTNAQMELFDPKGVKLLGSTGDIVRKVSAGNYLVLVSPASSTAESGGFAVALQRPNNPCSPGALACGQTTLQPLTAAGQLDAYTFSGNAGDQLSVTVTTRQGNYSPVTELYDQAASNNLPVPGSPGGATLTANLTSTSNYTLTVHDRVGNTGSYRVGLQRTNNACAENDTQKPVISLRRPTGGEVIVGGAVFQIAWQSDDNIAVASHAIKLSTDGGKTFTTITGAGALSGVAQSFNWVVPSDITPTRTAMIQVTATDKAGNAQTATSDALAVIGSGFTSNTAITYQYDPLNRLVQATYQDGRVVNYTYDPAGNLATITVQ